VAITTASISGSPSSSSGSGVATGMPNSAAQSRSTCGLATALTRASGTWRTRLCVCMVPIRPTPMTPTAVGFMACLWFPRLSSVEPHPERAPPAVVLLLARAVAGAS
jgi:hypothetical protein